MKNIKKWIIPAIGAMLIITTGCSSNSTTTGQSQGNAAVSSPTQKVSIELFNQKKEIKENMDQIIKDFQAQNPNIEVKQVQVPDSQKVLNARMASNDIPDIMSIFPNDPSFQTQAESNFFLDLTGSDVLANVNPTFLKDIKHNGKDYSVPLTMNAYGIFYNVDKFNELGLKVPTTWAELEQTTAAIKAKGLIPFATSFKAQWSTGHLAESTFTNLAGVTAANKFYTDPAVKADSNADFQKLIAKMDFIAQNSQPDAPGHDYPDAVNLFAKGQALMMPQGIWAVPMIKQAGMANQYKMFPVPNDSGKGVVLGGIDYALAIAANTKHPEEAKKFVKFMTEQKTAQYLEDNEKSPSTIQNVKSSAPETEDVTKLLFEQGRFNLWLHFNWKPGQGPSWDSDTSMYLISKDKKAFTNSINKDLGK
jgi:raffinose/stachyose/melibiose transport system substrate-binding protein